MMLELLKKYKYAKEREKIDQITKIISAYLHVHEDSDNVIEAAEAIYEKFIGKLERTRFDP
jgi:hypothetical protein